LICTLIDNIIDIWINKYIKKFWLKIPTHELTESTNHIFDEMYNMACFLTANLWDISLDYEIEFDNDYIIHLLTESFEDYYVKVFDDLCELYQPKL
jgi:predicted transport protein